MIFFIADLEMAEGTPEWQTQQAQDHIIDSLYKLNENYKAETGDDIGLINHIFSWGYDGRFSSSMMELTRTENRRLSSNEIATQWRGGGRYSRHHGVIRA